MKISTVSEMRALDKAAIEHWAFRIIAHGKCRPCLFEVIRQECGIPGKSFIVVAGWKHGGDGLWRPEDPLHGWRSKVFLCGEAGKYKGSARSNLEIIRKLPSRSLKSLL
jgi:hypothetical protein